MHQAKPNRTIPYLLLTILGCVLWLSPSRIHGQGLSESLAITAVEAGSFPTIKVTVTLADQFGRSLPAPSPADLRFSVDGTQLEAKADTVTVLEQPISVALLMDTGTAMGQGGTVARNRQQDAIALAHFLIDRLPPNSQVGLITFSERANLVLPLSTDGGAVRNVLDTIVAGSSETFIDAPGQAVDLAMTQLAADPARLGLIFMFTAQPKDALRNMLASRASPGRTLTPITMIGLGVDQSIQQPAVLATDAVYVPIVAPTIDEVVQTTAGVLGQYDGMLARRRAYQVEAVLPPIIPGDYRLGVSLNGQVADYPFRVEQVRPQVTISVPNPMLTTEMRLTSKVEFAQTKVLTVEYVLDNVKIGESTQAPEFPLALGSVPGDILERFSPDVQYSLYAAAIDENGMSGRSEPVMVNPPPPPSQNWLVGAIGVGVLVLISILVYMLRRKQMYQDNKSDSGSRKPSESQDPRYDPTDRYDAIADNANGDITERYERPERNGFQQQPVITVKYTVAHKEYNVDVSERQFTVGRNPNNTIVINNRHISSFHARFTLSDNGLSVTDLQSANGTFVNGIDDSQRLTPNQSCRLKDGDSVWIGHEVELFAKRRAR